MTIILILDSLGFSLTRHNVSGETSICKSMQHREERLVYPPATAYTALQLACGHLHEAEDHATLDHQLYQPHPVFHSG